MNHYAIAASIGVRLRSGTDLVRAWLCYRRFAIGSTVQFSRDVRYVEKLDHQHLPYVPAGMLAIVRGIGLMPGHGIGYVVELLDGGHCPTGYWTGAVTADLRAA